MGGELVLGAHVNEVTRYVQRVMLSVAINSSVDDLDTPDWTSIRR